MVNFMKAVGIFVLFGMMSFTGTVLAYDDITTDISASINSQVIDELSANITATDTTIATTNTNIQAGLALLGNEVVNVTAGGGTSSLTVTRGSNSTTADAHSEGDSIRQLIQNVDVVFTPENMGTYALGDKVVVYIPNVSPNSFGAMPTAATITESGAAVFGAASFDSDARTITFTVTTAGTVSQTTIAISSVVMPNVPGQYLLPVEIRSASETLLEMGSAPLSWANQVRVRAIIQPALIFTIDKSNIDITANPSVNDGENYAQKSILSVATNALNGYNISAKLEGKQTPANAQLDSAATTTVIVSGDAESVENTFGYVAYNGDGTAMEQPTTTVGRTAMNNATAQDLVRSRTQIQSDASVVTAFANTDTTLLPVTATGADVVPGNGSNELAFDAFINMARHTVYYGLNVDYLMPSAEYEGLITYTATPSF